MSIAELVRFAGAFGTLLTLLSSGCLSTGCVLHPDYAAAAGIKQGSAGITAKRTRTGFEFEVGSNFNGKADYKSTPEGALEVHLEVASNASDVTLAQGERAKALEGIAAAYNSLIITQQAAAWQGISSMFNMALSAAPQFIPRPVPVPVPDSMVVPTTPPLWWPTNMPWPPFPVNP